MGNGSEVEVKFEADSVDFMDFTQWLLRSPGSPRGAISWTNWKPAFGNDCYWVHSGGGAPVRHRHDDGAGWDELTVKARKSQTSTLDRHEINVPAGCQNQKIIRDFLRLAGFSEQLDVAKKSDIIHGYYGQCRFCFALYDAWIAGRPETRRRFLEIELEPEYSTCETDESLLALAEVAEMAKTALRLGDPVNYSLYEYFSKVAAGELPPPLKPEVGPLSRLSAG